MIQSYRKRMIYLHKGKSKSMLKRLEKDQNLKIGCL